MATRAQANTDPMSLTILLVVVLVAGDLSGQTPRQPYGRSADLIARWSFDEASGPVCKDSSQNEYHATLTDRHAGSLERLQGVFGRALHLSGQHALEIPNRLDLSEIRELTLCAWVRPTGFTAYNEIFRKEDGDRRVLFSFQHNGSILSLGIHVAGRGYQELDARIRPQDFLDRQWHHVAGTFDGKTMRVYVDGQEIAALDYPGQIVTGRRAPAYIGSSNGSGEFLQGDIDDLQVWGAAVEARQKPT